jgi:4-amino-4-deoxy-L-arabinose transferase-like glycosyltransferase
VTNAKVALPPRARAVLVVAAALFSTHLALAGRYGIFRDELYYVACGEHLDFGYVDHPPVVALLARLSHALFGESLYGLRLIPALAAAGLVFLAAELARAMRGDRYAQLVAALGVTLPPGYLFMGHILSMNCVEPLVWGGAALASIFALVHARPRA